MVDPSGGPFMTSYIDLGTGLLVNQTEGGEGIINISPELRQKRIWNRPYDGNDVI